MKKYKYLFVFASVVSLGLLVAPPTVHGLLAILILSIAGTFLLCRFYDSLALQLMPHKSLLLYTLTTETLLCLDFYLRWAPSSKIAALSGIAGVPVRTLLSAVSGLLGLLSIWAADAVISCMRMWLRNKDRLVKKTVYTFIVFLLQYLCLEYSATNSITTIIQRSIDVVAANILLICITNLIVLLMLQKWKATLTFTSFVFFLWSIANYYTIKFHGSPLYLSEFANARTAAAVAMNYRYRISDSIVCILLLFCSALYLVIQNTSLLDEHQAFGRRMIIRICVLSVFVLVTIPVYNLAIMKDRPWMPWELSIEKCGFLLCTSQDMKKRSDPVYRPDGYETAELSQFDSFSAADPSDYPDIIVILNETFSDLNQYSDLNEDTDPLFAYKNIKNAVYGNAVIPGVGGGTNNSEYELLTSRSMYLLKSDAPFTYLAKDLLQRSTVRYLAGFGYTTAAFHCASGQNYSRDTAYPALGFDIIRLGKDQFSYYGTNGKRAWLDSDNYRDMIDCYESMPNSPRFMYLLTFQNHGGYEQNDASLDTIHVQGDFGSLTDDLNEYLSSLQLSAEAFRSITDYFSEKERNVIVCMVGDHAPSFISELPAKKAMSFEESEIAKRTVPFVIWTNYDTEVSLYTEYASMVDLFPMLMHIAGIPQTAFFHYILDLHEQVPVRTSTNVYYTRDGRYGMLEEDDPYYNLIMQYYYMEYNSLLNSDNYISRLFECAG